MAKTQNNINGIINIYKEAGYTSFDVVAKLRGITGQRKIGHTGTLDPDATGVLPVVLGNATKLVDIMTNKEKEYVASFLLGKTTDTEDISGTVLTEAEVCCSEAEVLEVIKSFVGDIMQVPPMYSALKVNGKKLYELAREGKVVERQSRPVTIISIDDINIDMPNITMRVRCSKGTYIRTLCSDIGKKLGCGAVMTSLERTASGQYDLSTALKLSDVQALKESGRLSDAIISVDSLFTEYASVVLSGEMLRLALNGNMLDKNDIDGLISKNGDRSRLRVYNDDGAFFALYEKSGRKYKAYKMFLGD